MARTTLLIALLVILGGCSAEGSIPVEAPGCAGVEGSYLLINNETLASITAADCRGSDGQLLAEVRAFDVLGRSLWRVPGPTIDTLVVTVERSAERPDGDQPRTLPLRGEQATEQWGLRPVAAGADGEQELVRSANDAALLVLCGLAAAVGTLVLVGMVRGLRRGQIVFIWFLR